MPVQTEHRTWCSDWRDRSAHLEIRSRPRGGASSTGASPGPSPAPCRIAPQPRTALLSLAITRARRCRRPCCPRARQSVDSTRWPLPPALRSGASRGPPPGLGQRSLGAADAPQPRGWCARLSPVWRAPPVNRAGQRVGGDSPSHPVGARHHLGLCKHLPVHGPQPDVIFLVGQQLWGALISHRPLRITPQATSASLSARSGCRPGP